MPTRVLLTIDTELRWRPDPAAAWEEAFAASYECAGVGVPWQIERLAAHGLAATFFVDPMPAVRWGIEPIRRMVAPILAAGCDVQLHLHPQWATNAAFFELTGVPEPVQRALIAEARELLIEAGAPAPVAFRAGSYAADDATLRALAALGLRYDSSHNGGIRPELSAIRLPRDLVAPVRHCGVVEVPVSLIGAQPNLRHLQLCAVSIGEMRAAIEHAIRHDHPLVTILSHSFELATRDGARPNPTHVRRFEALCRLLAEYRDVAPTVGFDALAALPLDAAADAWPGGTVQWLVRGAEQLWSNLYHERRA